MSPAGAGPERSPPRGANFRGVSDPLLERVRAALGSDFEIIRRLGQGGMASVFLAREIALNRLVAIKVLDPDLGASPVFGSRFQREAETAAALQHPHVVSILRVGTADGLSYIVMAYVDGGSLADRMVAQGPLPLAEAIRIAREVASALAAAHKRGFLHRDVKPQNILLDAESGRALVVDFGIAGAVAGSVSSDPGSDRLTGLGMVVGTPRYMSPEQASGTRDLGPASDLYALGIVFYEMLAGAYPYQLSSPSGAAAAHLVQSPVPIHDRRPDLPPAAERVLDRLLAKDPTKRYQSGDEVVTELDSLLAPVSGEAAIGHWVRRTGKRTRWAAGVVALLLVVLGGWWMRSGTLAADDGIYRSLLIGYFDVVTPDPKLNWIRVGGVKLLAGQLQRWDDVRVIDAERLLDLSRRASVSPDSQLSLDDARRMARDAGVKAVTLGSVYKFGERITVQLKVYSVATGNEILLDSASVENDSLLPGAFRQLGDRLLTAVGAPVAQLAGEEPPTRSIDAWAAYIQGIRDRSAWRVDSAKAAFARATAADPGFAIAWLHRSTLVVDDAWSGNEAVYAAYADSALAHSADRPVRERELIQGYNDLVHARFADARRMLGAVTAKDSTNALAWSLLGLAWQLDLTLDTVAGRPVLPGSYAKALRAYERALALDETDHTLFARVAAMYSSVGSKEGQTIPVFAAPPAGDVHTVFNRIPTATLTTVFVGDSIALIPSDSLALRYPPRVLDSLRGRARARALAVTRRWLTAAPLEGAAYLQLAFLAAASQQYDSALAAAARAEQLGVPNQEMMPFLRMQFLVGAGDLPAMMRLADSIGSVGPDSVFKAYSLQASPIANAWVLAGREREAGQLVALLQAVVGARSPEIRRFMNASPDFFGLLSRSAAGVVTRDEVRSASTAYRRGLQGLSGPGQERVRAIVRTPVRVAAAAVGDTTTLAAWPQEGADTNWSLYAWAYAEAGDTARARRTLARVTAMDTSTSAIRLWSLARAYEAVGRKEEALKYYRLIDSLPLSVASDVDPFLIFRARALPAAAAILESQGEKDEARERYQRFIALWEKADPALQPEVQLARQSLRTMDLKAD
jgi:tetratricopeptide (TPR) repeat protein